MPLPTPRQPVPDVTPVDVKRIVERDFKDEFSTVMVLLNEFGAERQDRGSARAQLAALKLANGNLEKLRSYLESARRDYRDVVAYAEYPEYIKKGSHMRELPAKERLRVIDDTGDNTRRGFKNDPIQPTCCIHLELFLLPVLVFSRLSARRYEVACASRFELRGLKPAQPGRKGDVYRRDHDEPEIRGGISKTEAVASSLRAS